MSKDGARDFGQYLANFLAHSGRYTTPTAFARDAGISASAVSRWINGKERPTPRLLERIAPHLGADVRELFALAYPESAAEAELVTLPAIHPLALEISRMLMDGSPVPAEDREALRMFLDRAVDPYRQLMRRRRTA